MMKKKKRKPDAIDRLYDSFTTKDMTRLEFRKRYLAATNPRKLQEDLGKGVKYRQTEQTQRLVAQHQRQKIDNAVLEN